MAIPEQTLQEVRDKLKNASRPLIFFDDDADGLASYLLAYKYNNQCIGVRVSRGPELSERYARKVQENMPDLVLILDKPRVEKSFFDTVKTPTYWIDHHDTSAQKPQEWKYQQLTYLNPTLTDEEDTRPVAYWMYQITKGPLWIASVGVTSDWDESLLKQTQKELPELVPELQGIEHTLFRTPLGVLIRIFNFLQKGRNSKVRKCLSALKHVEQPEELLKQNTPRGKFVHKHYDNILQEYMRSLMEAKKTEVEEGIYCHIFTHMNISFVSDLANELLTRVEADIVLVGRAEQGRVKFSMRSKQKNLQRVIEQALVGIDGYGGGHKEAVGGNINSDDWEQFFSQLKEARTSF